MALRAASSPSARTLDIGCGFGTLAGYLSLVFEGDTYCVDMRNDVLDTSVAEQHGLVFAVCNFELEPLPWSGPFDVIVLTEVLEHLNYHPVPTLARLGSLLSDNGNLYLSTPDASEWGRVTTYYESISDMPSPEIGGAGVASGEWEYVDAHIWQYMQAELEEVIGAAGLSVVRRGVSPGVLHRHFNLELAKAT